MSVSGIRNRITLAGVRTEMMNHILIIKGHTGKPDLPCVNAEKPQRAEGASRNTPPTACRLSLTYQTREASLGMLRLMGSRRGANALRKANVLICNTDEREVAEGAE